MDVFHGKMPEPLPLKVPELYKRLPVGFLEGDNNPAILSEAFWRIYAEMNIKPPDASDPLRICFYSAGGGRAEMYIIEQLICMGYRFDEVCLCDSHYANETTVIYINLVTQMDVILRGKYKLLVSNDALITNTLREIEESKEDPNKFKYDAIIGIHIQATTMADSGNYSANLMYIRNLMNILSTWTAMSKIASKIAPNTIGSFFPQAIIIVRRSGPSEPHDLFISRKPLIITHAKYIEVQNIVNRMDRGNHDQDYTENVSPLLVILRGAHDEFMKANPMFAINGTFGIPQQGGHQRSYHHNRRMYWLL